MKVRNAQLSMLVLSAVFIIVILLIPFLPENIAQTHGPDLHQLCIYVLPPFLFIFCGYLWLYLSSNAEQDRDRCLFRTAIVLSALTVLWVIISQTLSDGLDSLTIDRSWKDGAYFIWAGATIFAVDVTVMLWSAFRTLKLMGGGPVPYIVAALIVLFLAPLSSLATTALGVDIGDLWGNSRVLLFSLMVATAVSISLIWGMISDRSATEKVRGEPSYLKMAAAAAILMVGSPLTLLILWVLFGGFS